MSLLIRSKWTLIVLSIFCFNFSLIAGNGLSEMEIREKVKDLDISVNVNVNSIVKKQIRQYVVKNKNSSEVILGRGAVYFPIIEDYLRKYNLPDDLKYLVAVESSVRTNVFSKVGAGGLWQFMPKTGKAFGLEIDSYIDERLDPYKSTEAAMKYLSKLHKRYDDWALALAAYNCGPSKVNKAIKKSGSRDFWKLSKYLPKETRAYVPRFIAFCYVGKYHQFYDINPKYPDYNELILETVKVDNYTTFKKIASYTGISIKKIKALNPAYKVGLIPIREDGNYIILPRLDAIAYKDKVKEESSSYNYYVQNGESLQSIAQMNKCKIEEILDWNALKNDNIFVNQKLRMFPTEIEITTTQLSMKFE